MDKNDSGMKKETKEAACYIPFFGWIPAAVFLFLEKDKAIRWNAMQSLVLHGILAGIYWVVLPMMQLTIVLMPVTWLVQGLTGVGFLILTLVLLMKTYQGETVKLPFVADVTDKILKKIKLGE